MSYQYRVLPCPNFGINERDIISRYGFLTYPAFIDNGFKTKGGMKWKKAIKNAKLLHPLFFIAHDTEPLKDIDEIKRYAANIILPIHDLNDYFEYKEHFEWFGFPNSPKLRNYEIHEFLRTVSFQKKKWWLGIHDYPVSEPSLILQFEGLDSTLPELYAGQYGKIWRTWRDYYKPGNSLHWRTIFEQNVQNFRLFLDGLKPIKGLVSYIQ